MSNSTSLQSRECSPLKFLMKRHQTYHEAGERVQAQDLEPSHGAGEARPLCLHTISVLRNMRPRKADCSCLAYNEFSIRDTLYAS